MAGRQLDIVLLAGATVLLVAIGGVRVSTRLGVPTLLLYLGLGMGIGENGLGVHFDDAQLAQDLGLIALALILAEGGLTTSWRGIRAVLPAAVSLALAGTAASVAVTAAAARLVLDADWRTAALLGAVLAPTDAAAVFATLRSLRLPPRLTGLLEAESGFNDAPAVIVVTLLSSADTVTFPHTAGLLGYELVVGTVVGLAIGALGVRLLEPAALPAAGLYPVATLTFAIASYAAAASVGASGFLAIYLTALKLGNARLPHRRATLGFADGVAWLAQIGLFVMLGLLATPARLTPAILPALAIAVVLLLLARPLSVALATTPFGFRWREQVLLSTAGLRGAVPIVLTTIPVTADVPQARLLFDTVFVIVAVLTLVQAPTLAPLARALRFRGGGEAVDLTVEAAPLDELHADLLTVRIPPRSRLHRVELWELRLPPGAAVALVVRRGAAFVPEPHTTLEQGDDLLIVTTRADRAATERRLQAVSRSGKLARFLDDNAEE